MYAKKAFTIEEKVQQLKDRELFISESDKMTSLVNAIKGWYQTDIDL